MDDDSDSSDDSDGEDMYLGSSDDSDNEGGGSGILLNFS